MLSSIASVEALSKLVCGFAFDFVIKILVQSVLDFLAIFCGNFSFRNELFCPTQSRYVYRPHTLAFFSVPRWTFVCVLSSGHLALNSSFSFENQLFRPLASTALYTSIFINLKLIHCCLICCARRHCERQFSRAFLRPASLFDALL